MPPIMITGVIVIARHPTSIQGSHVFNKITGRWTWDAMIPAEQINSRIGTSLPAEKNSEPRKTDWDIFFAGVCRALLSVWSLSMAMLPSPATPAHGDSQEQ
ncbi:MAG: hypothetical protein ACPGXX_01520, partial [Planctomycetaceae bacterium]